MSARTFIYTLVGWGSLQCHRHWHGIARTSLDGGCNRSRVQVIYSLFHVFFGQTITELSSCSTTTHLHLIARLPLALGQLILEYRFVWSRVDSRDAKIFKFNIPSSTEASMMGPLQNGQENWLNALKYDETAIGRDRQWPLHNRLSYSSS